MEDKAAVAAAEARREKIRNLEFSLFGENNSNGVVGLPRVKAVDEYHEKYSDVYKDKLKKDDNNRVDLPLFYKEPQKKVKRLSPAEDLKSFLGSDESTQATPAPPDLEDKFFIKSVESGSSTRLQSRKQSARPKTVETLLSEELDNLGVSDSKLANNDYAQKLREKKVEERKHSQYISDIHEDEGGATNLIKVGQFEEARGKARFLSQEKNNVAKNKVFTKKISRSEKLLNMEQDELSMSLSSAKFKLLKNANLERVKAEERLSEEDEGKILGHNKNAKNKTNNTFKDMPDHIYDEMPSDTFKDIPDDVFDNIPRAVTARIRNREKTKAVQKEQESFFETDQVDYTASAPAIPVDGDDNQEEATSDKEATSVGFIAMLFTGAPLANSRQTANMDQVESDFMFALFIQKQEEEANMNSNRPAQSNQQEEDSSIGHFCAPHLPGFCQANFCLFHTSGPEH